MKNATGGVFRFSLLSRCLFYYLMLAAVVAAAFLCLAPQGRAEVSAQQEDNAVDWRAEFDEICLKVQEGRALSIEELESLLERSDKLMPVIEGSNDPKKKVFLFRLKKCRQFFEYIIELKKSGKSEPVS